MMGWECGVVAGRGSREEGESFGMQSGGLGGWKEGCEGLWGCLRRVVGA
jgi:hypothetical protein